MTIVQKKYSVTVGGIRIEADKPKDFYSQALKVIVDNRDKFDGRIPMLLSPDPKGNQYRYLINTSPYHSDNSEMDKYETLDGLFVYKRNSKPGIEQDITRLLRIALGKD